VLRSRECKATQLPAQPDRRRFHALLQLLPGSSHAAGNFSSRGSCNSHSSWSGSNTGRSPPPSATTRAGQGREGPIPSLCWGAARPEQHSDPAIARCPPASEDLQPNRLPRTSLELEEGTTPAALAERLSSSKGQSGVARRRAKMETGRGVGSTPRWKQSRRNKG